MNALDKLKTILQGKKTYIVAFCMAVLGILKWLGIDIPGVTDTIDPIAWLLSALGLSSIRAAITKQK